MMRLLKHMDDPKFNAIYFRRETTQLKGQGGLWESAQDMYRPFGAYFKQGDMKAIFPEGANAKFSHLQHNDDRFSHQG